MSLFILAPDPNGVCCDCNGRTNPCDPCTPTACTCQLRWPIVTPYSSYAAANDVIQGSVPNQKVGCYGLATAISGNEIGAFSSTITSDNELTLSAAIAAGTSLNLIGSVTLAAGSPSIDYSITVGTAIITAQLLTCNWVNIQTKIASASSSGTLVFSSVVEGEYKVIVTIVFDTPSIGNVGSCVIKSGGARLVANPVILLYTDGAVTIELDVCPKMLLPPLTENTGNWYASLLTASSVLASDVASCLAYSHPVFTPTIFTASTGSNLFNVHIAVNSTGEITVYCSINLVVGQTLSCEFNRTASGGGTGGAANRYSFAITIYDYTGTFIQTIAEANSANPTVIDTLVSSALPYTGRFIIKLELLQPVQQGGAPNSDLSVELSSSGNLTGNLIQALYATTPLLDCPARLNC